MCITCGCNETSLHQHADEHYLHKHLQEDYTHHHTHESHIHEPQHQYNVVNLETAILAENAQFAQQNREFFNSKKVLALNLLSSPGSGKTTLLETTIKNIDNKHPIYVIEGDQHTELDAKRIRDAGAEAYQINTGKTCHLDGHMVSHAIEHLSVQAGGLLFIENVGNLICPALFDLGEHVKVVIISVTEGADKPLKYPDMFYAANLVIINKIDLLPFVQFDIEQCITNIQKINSRAKIIQLSATIPNSGMTEWISWLHSCAMDKNKYASN
jgi:hydrogenase nickel incorporation protein HypB